jgi:hypothetical protein
MNTSWGWEVENHFQGKGNVEGENDQISLFRRLCWDSFELNSANNRQCEERKKGYYPKYWIKIIPIFSILPKNDCCYLQQASWLSPHGLPILMALQYGNQDLIPNLAPKIWDNLQVHSQGMLTLHFLSLYNIILITYPRCINFFLLSM